MSNVRHCWQLWLWANAVKNLGHEKVESPLFFQQIRFFLCCLFQCTIICQALSYSVQLNSSRPFVFKNFAVSMGASLPCPACFHQPMMFSSLVRLLELQHAIQPMQIIVDPFLFSKHSSKYPTSLKKKILFCTKPFNEFYESNCKWIVGLWDSMNIWQVIEFVFSNSRTLAQMGLILPRWGLILPRIPPPTPVLYSAVTHPFRGYVYTQNTPIPTSKHPFSWPELESGQNKLPTGQPWPHLGKMSKNEQNFSISGQKKFIHIGQ